MERRQLFVFRLLRPRGRGCGASSGSGSYLAFGPADPSAKKSLMGGADVAVVGFGNNTASSAYIRDFYLRDYLPCTVNADSGLVMGRAVLTYMHVLVLSEIRFLSALIKLN
jgi:hypothetical protein